MRKELYWGLGGLVVLIIVGGVFWLIDYRADMKQFETGLDEANRKLEARNKTKNTPKVTSDDGISIRESTENITEGVDEPDSVDQTVQTSSNPMFASGVPEHLQCPKQWIGKYGREIKTSRSELSRISRPRIDEILSKYNPERPLTEVWPLFIEAEKYYYTNADPELAHPGQGAGRLDWVYQNLLDFPEVFVLGNIDTERYVTMRQVAIGRWEPDLNLHILQDGREFRAKTGYNYEEIMERIEFNEKGDLFTGSSIKFGHSDRNAEVVKIYLSDTSDEELEQLGGWNYNIDPYATGIYTLPKDATERVLEMNRLK